MGDEQVNWFKPLAGIVMFFAPPQGADMESNLAQRSWQWKTFFAVLIAYAVGGLHIAWVCNAFAPYGFAGAAWASDLIPVNNALKDLQITNVEGEIHRHELVICRLVAASNADPNIDRGLLQSALDTEQAQYRMAVGKLNSLGRQYMSQPCSVILIAGGK